MKITNPNNILRMADLDSIINWPNRVVYVDDLQKLAEHLGTNWSALANEVEWRGWTWRNLR